MPTIFRIGSVKIIIYPHDHWPPHVHAIGPNCEAKFYITSLTCYYSKGLTLKDIKRITKALEDNKDKILGAWNDLKNK